jgi:hypothetical protein
MSGLGVSTLKTAWSAFPTCPQRMAEWATWIVKPQPHRQRSHAFLVTWCNFPPGRPTRPTHTIRYLHLPFGPSQEWMVPFHALESVFLPEIAAIWIRIM